MRAAVKKWGNSASVRIPATVLKAANLRLDEPVDVREESGRIVIEPVRRKEYHVAELVKGITRENLHKEVDFGAPVGKSKDLYCVPIGWINGFTTRTARWRCPVARFSE